MTATAPVSSRSQVFASNAIIPLELTFEINTVVKTGLLVYVIREFCAISVSFEWDSERQHEEFSRVLGPADRLNWENVIESIPVGAIYDLNHSLDQFKANYMPSDARLQQLEFLKYETHRGFSKTF